MMLNKRNLFFFFVFIFLCVFLLSFAFVGIRDSEHVVSTKQLMELSQLSNKVTDLLELEEEQKRDSLNKMIENQELGFVGMLYRNWQVKLGKNSNTSKKHSQFFSWSGESKIAMLIPVGKNEIKGAVVAQISTQNPVSIIMIGRIMVAFAMALFGVVCAIWFKAKQATQEIDHLCQEFTKYRRQHDSSDLVFSQQKFSNHIQKRTYILQQIWEQFLQTQKLLKIQVQKLEETVANLEIAEGKAQRFAVIGQAVAKVGHDMGNSNAALKSYVELSLKSFSKEPVLSPEMQKVLGFMQRMQVVISTLSALKNNLMEFISGKSDVNPAPYYLEELLHKVDANLGFIDKQRDGIDINLIKPEELQVRIDIDQMTRVIVNLVKNAWQKHHATGGSITVSLMRQKQDLLISIEDDGDAIPESIFHSLFQVLATEGKAEGVGIGLSVCKQIIEAHQGRITAENLSESKGVKFSIFIPSAVIE